MAKFKGLPLEKAVAEVLREGSPVRADLIVDKDGVHIDPMSGTPITLTWRALEILLSMNEVQAALARRSGREIT